MGSNNSKPSTTSRGPYRQAAAGINARYPDGLGHTRIAAAIPGRKGKAPEIMYLRQNDEGKYAYDQEYYDQMEELAKKGGAGVWDKKPEGYRGIGNIDQGEESVPAGLREDMRRKRVYAPAGIGDKKGGGGRRGHAPIGKVHMDKERQAFVRRKN
ncbi:hypothetical protein N0V87_003184 [Didymella glomerata]|uniref:Uncharacterized protein n=1 Tax=Didymella glomerata TaxID=749621 RepID=A0A9W8X3R3_9PLEO|nr:hypothetical protein N0V87_003184 [Didymella glomerata]